MKETTNREPRLRHESRKRRKKGSTTAKRGKQPRQARQGLDRRTKKGEPESKYTATGFDASSSIC